MPELHDLLERRASGHQPPPDLFDRVVDRHRRRDRNRRIGAVLVAVAVIAVVIGGALRAASERSLPAIEPTPTPVYCVNAGWPDTTRNPGGPNNLYSWDGGGGGSTVNEGFMHNGYAASGAGETEIWLGVVEPADAIPTDATAVNVAGHEGVYRSVDASSEDWAVHLFDGDEQIRGPVDSLREEWIVEIEGTTIAIHLIAEPGTSRTALADAHAVVDSLRTQPCDTRDFGFVLLFTLPSNDWDSG